MWDKTALQKISFGCLGQRSSARIHGAMLQVRGITGIAWGGISSGERATYQQAWDFLVGKDPVTLQPAWWPSPGIFPEGWL